MSTRETRIRWSFTKRLFLVFGILFLRLGFNFLGLTMYRDGEAVRAMGEVIEIDQSVYKCEARIESFKLEIKGKCRFKKGEKVMVSGRIRKTLIESLMGHISLVDGEITPLSTQWEKGLGARFGEFVELKFESWRGVLRNRVNEYLPPLEAALVMGIVMGEKENLPFWFYDNLINSGTVHIIVASGFNVMIVGGTVLVVTLGWLKRKWATLVAILVMTLYALLASWQPPVVRALIMGSLIFLGQAWGRSSSTGWSLFFVSCLMIIIDPTLITSISFQLSVAACVGIFWLEPKLSSRFEGKSLILNRTEMLPTVAAQITTLPFILFYFGRVSWISILSNTLVLPLIPWLMAFGALVMFLPFTWPAAYLLSRVVIEMVKFFGV